MQLSQEGGKCRENLKDERRALWFRSFTGGVRKRTWVHCLPDLALSTDLLLNLLKGIGAEIRSLEDLDEIFSLIIIGLCIVSSHVLSFKGSDALHLDLIAMVKDSLETQPFVIVALRAKLKGEKDKRNHLFPVVEVTYSGVQVN